MFGIGKKQKETVEEPVKEPVEDEKVEVTETVEIHDIELTITLKNDHGINLEF